MNNYPAMVRPCDGYVLLVGDGDFSFTVSLMTLGSLDPWQITTSNLETVASIQQHKLASSNMQTLTDMGVKVYLETDARELHRNPAINKTHYQRVIFNFPLADRHNIKKNRSLLADFFASCSQIISDDGQVMVTLCKGQGGTPADQPMRSWHDSWQVQSLAVSSGFCLSNVQPFDASMYPGYHSVGFRFQDKSFNTEGSLTHIFELADVVCQINNDLCAPATVRCGSNIFSCSRYVADRMNRNLLQDVNNPVCLLRGDLETFFIQNFGAQILQKKQDECILQGHRSRTSVAARSYFIKDNDVTKMAGKCDEWAGIDEHSGNILKNTKEEKNKANLNIISRKSAVLKHGVDRGSEESGLEETFQQHKDMGGKTHQLEAEKLHISYFIPEHPESVFILIQNCDDDSIASEFDVTENSHRRDVLECHMESFGNDISHVGERMACPDGADSNVISHVGERMACPDRAISSVISHVGERMACPDRADSNVISHVSERMACPDRADSSVISHVSERMACPDRADSNVISHVSERMACPDRADSNVISHVSERMACPDRADSNVISHVGERMACPDRADSNVISHVGERMACPDRADSNVISHVSERMACPDRADSNVISHVGERMACPDRADSNVISHVGERMACPDRADSNVISHVSERMACPDRADSNVISHVGERMACPDRADSNVISHVGERMACPDRADSNVISHVSERMACPDRADSNVISHVSERMACPDRADSNVISHVSERMACPDRADSNAHKTKIDKLSQCCRGKIFHYRTSLLENLQELYMCQHTNNNSRSHLISFTQPKLTSQHNSQSRSITSGHSQNDHVHSETRDILLANNEDSEDSKSQSAESLDSTDVHVPRNTFTSETVPYSQLNEGADISLCRQSSENVSSCLGGSAFKPEVVSHYFENEALKSQVHHQHLVTGQYGDGPLKCLLQQSSRDGSVKSQRSCVIGLDVGQSDYCVLGLNSGQCENSRSTFPSQHICDTGNGQPKNAVVKCEICTDTRQVSMHPDSETSRTQLGPAQPDLTNSCNHNLSEIPPQPPAPQLPPSQQPPAPFVISGQCFLPGPVVPKVLAVRHEMMFVHKFSSCNLSTSTMSSHHKHRDIVNLDCDIQNYNTLLHELISCLKQCKLFSQMSLRTHDTDSSVEVHIGNFENVCDLKYMFLEPLSDDEDTQEVLVGFMFQVVSGCEKMLVLILELDNIACHICHIPDLRLLWSQNKRFTGQFSASSFPQKFSPFSLYPLKHIHDVSFWIKDSYSQFDTDGMCSIIRHVAGDLVVSVNLIDCYTDPRTGKQSRCYRLQFLSHDLAFPYLISWKLQSLIRLEMSQKLAINLR